MKTVQIKLSNSSEVALIDEDDYLLVSLYTWRLKKSAYVSYVCATKAIGKKRLTLRLHRLIMNASPGMDVHHINHNVLDCRKANLEELPIGQHRGHPKEFIEEFVGDEHAPF